STYLTNQAPMRGISKSNESCISNPKSEIYDWTSLNRVQWRTFETIAWRRAVSGRPERCWSLFTGKWVLVFLLKNEHCYGVSSVRFGGRPISPSSTSSEVHPPLTQVLHSEAQPR